jgi:ankyrin repeat protein
MREHDRGVGDLKPMAYLNMLVGQVVQTMSAKIPAREGLPTLPWLIQESNVNITDERGRSALHLAVLNGIENRAVISLLLRYQADINLKDVEGLTALHLTIDIGDIKLVRMLQEQGASTSIRDGDGRTALLRAIAQGKAGIAEELLTRDASILVNQGQDALRLVTEEPDKRMIEFLVRRGVNLGTENGQRTFELALERRWSQLLLSMISNGVHIHTNAGHRALIWAAQNFQDEVLKQLVSAGINVGEPDSNGMTALEYAANRDNVNAVVMLLAAKNMTHQSKANALWWASRNGLQRMLRLLIENGGDVDVALKSQTALVAAATYEHWNVVQLLVGAGADANKGHDENGDTVLHLAARDRQWEIVRQLVQNGARTDVVNNDGEAPMDLVDDDDLHHFK